MKLTRHQAIRALVSTLFLPIFGASQQTRESGEATETVTFQTWRGPLAKIIDYNCTVESGSPPRRGGFASYPEYRDCEGPTWVQLDFRQIGGIEVRTDDGLIRVSREEIIESLEAGK